MRIWPQCIPCIYSARAREVLTSGIPDCEKVYALTALAAELSRANPFSSTIRLATETYRLVKQVTRNRDPYYEFKRESNKLVVERLLPLLKDKVERFAGYELFRELLVASIAANSLDPGVPGYEKLDVNLNVKLGRDESREAYELLKGAGRVVYALDNAGEALVDLEVVKLLRNMGVEVWILAKSQPYQNDVTLEEAVELGFAEYARVIGTGSDAAGPLPGELSSEALDAISTADVIIAKGMAAFESFEEWAPPKPVVHVLRAKCVPVAAAVGVSVGEGAIALRKPAFARNASF